MMNKLCEEYHHRAEITYDGDLLNDTVHFKWHWPRGTFDKRMSAYEIAAFILPHMHAITSMGILDKHPKAKAEFSAMLVRLATWPVQVLDEVLPWIKRLDYTEEDEILLLDIGSKASPSKTEYFV